jgi:hypothetical protein
MAEAARLKRIVSAPVELAYAAPHRRYVPAPIVSIPDAAGFPVRQCSLWLAASAITAAAVAYATGNQYQSRPAAFEVASVETRAVRLPEQSEAYRQPAPGKFADRWAQPETADEGDEPIMTGLIKPVRTVRFARPAPIEESIAETVASAPAGFALASANSRTVDIGKPAPASAPAGIVLASVDPRAIDIGKPAPPPAKLEKSEFDEVEQYLWEVYQRSPIKKDGAGDFTWKDPAAAKRMNMSMPKYVISGMDPDFREQLYHAGRAMDAGGVKWSILSAFRDDYRQTIASGLKAGAKNSLHGGSVRTGGYGHGRAVDITIAEGDANDVWEWIDDHGAKYGLYRPMPGYDPAHIQSRGDWRKVAKNLRQERIKTAQQRERDEAAQAKVASAEK